MSEKPSDVHLKEVRDGLIGDVVEQGRRMGAPVPNIRGVEKFIDPIMRRVEVDAEKTEAVESARETPDLNKSAKTGEWYGQPDHSPLIGGPGSRIQGEAEVKSRELGEYALSKDGTLKPKNGAPMPRAASVLELIIKKMVTHPSWREPILIATRICDKHMSALPGCVLCERREARLLEIVAKAKTTFTKQRERRLIVGGK